jgi:hypothetical protein
MEGAMITKGILEKWQTLQQAKEICDSYFDDSDTYPREDFYRRKGRCRGIGKLIPEEYSPLVVLAQELQKTFGPVRKLRLGKENAPVPDGEIRFVSGYVVKVQITCANEGQKKANAREQFARHQTVSEMLAPQAARQGRRDRIIEAIKKKSQKNKGQEDTDTLLVVEDPACFTYLEGLHEQVCEAIKNDLESLPYKRVYIDYGRNLKQVK